MTGVGKILVVLIALFSMLFLGFAVTVYSTRINWMGEKGKVDAELKKTQDQRTALGQRIDLLTTEFRQRVQDYEKEQKVYVEQIKDQKNAYDSVLAEMKTAREKMVQYESLQKIASDQETDRRNQATALYGMLKTTQEAKEKALKERFDLEQRSIEQQETIQTTTARLREAETKVAQLTATLDSYGFPLLPKEQLAKMQANPPQVEGYIKKVDPQGKFVEISLGSDDGLRKGHKLQVYRIKPQGKYVGQIEIADLDPERAVCRIIPQLRQANFQEGDLVATRITASQF
ncbi:MAG: hypothetical protein HY000_15085 [Planctomycetes bacterium]|nr:hypothetical protein [Planctomycetota bacterium]